MGDSIPVVDAVKYGDDLIGSALETKDFAMAGTLLNETPYSWKQVDQFGGPIENFFSMVPHGFAALSGYTPADSNPGWKHAPDSYVQPYDPKLGDVRNSLDLFVVEGTSHVYNFKQAGGFEVCVSFHCAEIEVTIILYMNHWQYASDDVEREVGGLLCGPSPYIKKTNGTHLSERETITLLEKAYKTKRGKSSGLLGFSTGNAKEIKIPIDGKNDITLAFVAAENTMFHLKGGD
ncbi:hypothetical protein AYJ57_21530 (plasmid) [Salipiger sp. CCB-MM3]|uniref:hypothetical protein n=1 Tax=Salipiger sp. CCB-MM3 TaxID=1792508 RepID=UPI00080A9E68|nr:hypothetical protein [Salipiger sp. CCB-MM3]ANT63056.1 hypothetical protein AYJ57_21530 [Salipiger sp. CCB-MM3]